MVGTAFTTDPICRDHDTGEGHPESPRRLDAVLGALEAEGLLERLTRLPVRDATPAELQLCHGHEYLAQAEQDIRAGAGQLRTGDTEIGAGSWAAAVRATGCVLSAVDAVMGGQAGNAFCAVRPPGHHATADRGMGFCVVNHVAVAARYAQQRWGAERVLVLDWDVHHGNGTQDIFYEDGAVFYYSTHQAPHYPGTGWAEERGAKQGAGTTLNRPLPAGSGRAEIFASLEQELRPAMEGFRPELILISAGFDSRVDDPLGDFRLRDEDFAELTRWVLRLAERHCGGRVVSALEGGYHLAGLGSAAVAHVRALLGE